MRELLFRIEALASVKLQLEPAAIHALPSRIDALVLRIAQPVVPAVCHRVSGRLQSLPHVLIPGHVLGAPEAERIPNRVVDGLRGFCSTGRALEADLVSELFLEPTDALEAVVEAD